MSIKSILMAFRATVMAVGLSAFIALCAAIFPGFVAMDVAFFSEASSQMSAAVGLGYVGFPVFFAVFIWGLTKTPTWLRNMGLM